MMSMLLLGINVRGTNLGICDLLKVDSLCTSLVHVTVKSQTQLAAIDALFATV